MGDGSGLKNGLGQQRHQPVTPAFRGDLQFDKIPDVLAGDQQIAFSMSEARSRLDPPSVLAKDIREQVEVFALVALGRGRAGRGDGHDLIVSTVIIMVVIMPYVKSN